MQHFFFLSGMEVKQPQWKTNAFSCKKGMINHLALCISTATLGATETAARRKHLQRHTRNLPAKYESQSLWNNSLRWTTKCSLDGPTNHNILTTNMSTADNEQNPRGEHTTFLEQDESASHNFKTRGTVVIVTNYFFLFLFRWEEKSANESWKELKMMTTRSGGQNKNKRQRYCVLSLPAFL